MRDIRFVLGAIVVIAACGGGGDNGAGPGGGGGGGGGTLVHATRVNANDALAFSPNAVTIPAGDTIYFTIGSVTHNVVFDSQGAPGNVSDASSTTVKVRFPNAGTFNYHCSIHGTATTGMRGTVTVQ